MAVFFESLVRVIRGARSHLSTNQVDSAKFWCRRIDEYELTMRLLLARVEVFIDFGTIIAIPDPLLLIRYWLYFIYSLFTRENNPREQNPVPMKLFSV